jgi:hypothetical protein
MALVILREKLHQAYGMEWRSTGAPVPDGKPGKQLRAKHIQALNRTARNLGASWVYSGEERGVGGFLVKSASPKKVKKFESVVSVGAAFAAWSLQNGGADSRVSFYVGPIDGTDRFDAKAKHWAIIGAQNGFPLAGWDKVVSHEYIVNDLFKALLEGTLPQIGEIQFFGYAPQLIEPGFDGTGWVDCKLDEISEQFSDVASLSKPGFSLDPKQAVGALVVVGMLGGAFVAYQKHQAAEKAKIAAKKVDPNVVYQRELATALATVGIPNSGDVSKIVAQIDAWPFAFAGAKLSGDITCDFKAGACAAAYIPGKGTTYAQFESAAKGIFDVVNFDPSGTRITVSKSVEKIVGDPVDKAALPKFNQVVVSLHSKWQALRATLPVTVQLSGAKPFALQSGADPASIKGLVMTAPYVVKGPSYTAPLLLDAEPLRTIDRITLSVAPDKFEIQVAGELFLTQ